MLEIEMERLLGQYELEVKEAFTELLGSFLQFLETGMGNPRSMAGKCGSRIGSAHKRCKRGVVFAGLELYRSHGLDITPTLAEHLCYWLLGRGVDFRAALDAFATPGRTAAFKTKTVPADLATLQGELRPLIDLLVIKMVQIRDVHRQDYRQQIRDEVRTKA